MAEQSKEKSAHVDFTMLVCTYNQATMLEGALESLAALRCPPGQQFEIVVVDNASTDATASVITNFAADHPDLAVHLLYEERQGVAYARKTGIRECRGRWIAYIDDDCRLRPDWLEAAAEFAGQHPGAGSFGGRNRLDWETPPDPVCEAYSESFAAQDWGDEARQWPIEGRRVPCGAGLVLLRNAVFESGYLERGILKGRHPRSITAGEDSEVQLMIREAGWEIWFAPGLHLSHRIPESRTTSRYLFRLHRGFGRAEALLYLLDTGREADRAGAFRALIRASGEGFRLLSRFWNGFIRYPKERPTWIIRFAHVIGHFEGASALLFRGGRR